MSNDRNRNSFQWIAFIFCLVFLGLLYLITGPLGEATFWFKVLLSAIPGIAIFALIIILSIQKTAGKNKSVLAATLSGLASSLIAFFLFADRIKEWVDKTETTITNSLFLLIVASIMILRGTGLKKT